MNDCNGIMRFIVFSFLVTIALAQTDSLIAANQLDSFKVVYNRSYRYADEQKKMALFDQAEQHLDTAFVAGLPESEYNARMALLSGVRAKTVSLGDKGPYLIEMERYASEALRLDSLNALANSMLGVLNFRLSTLSWIERIFSNAFIGRLPETSIEVAHRCFLKAVQLDPSRVSYHFFLAKSYYELDEEAKALGQLNLAVTMPAATAADQFYQDEARNMLEEIK